jgi:hypothetical protein
MQGCCRGWTFSRPRLPIPPHPRPASLLPAAASVSADAWYLRKLESIASSAVKSAEKIKASIIVVRMHAAGPQGPVIRPPPLAPRTPTSAASLLGPSAALAGKRPLAGLLHGTRPRLQP